MQQVLFRQGQAVARDVPVPVVEPGTVLVHVGHSCISIGTEMSGLRSSATPVWKRALRDPHFFKKAVEYAASQGITKTRQRLQDRAAAETASGYSVAGTVCEAGSGVTDFQVGDRVACAGAQCAHHAEFVRVPVNLAAVVPDHVGLSQASTVALGAIALQAVRRANPTLGETFVVVGLGILGQLVAQMLKAQGCRVIGADLDETRIQLARELGIQYGLRPDCEIDPVQVARITDGVGADGAIVTAASPSHQILSTAFQMCRRKGRVVLVGDVGLHLNREDIYAKELDFFVSTSYGPGRYDSRYEEQGLDYPVGYVRWTENRNMSEYLRLLAEGRVNVEPLISMTYPVADCAQAYARLKSETDRPLMVLLSYPKRDGDDVAARAAGRVVVNPKSQPSGADRIRIAVVGPGDFAKAVHLPNLREFADRFHIQAVVARSGHNAVAVAGQYGARYATTDFARVLQDDDVDAVLIATRHDLHGEQVRQALEVGKHVLVEKPLALTRWELDQIISYYSTIGTDETAPVLLTGFNRRFSPTATLVKRLVANRVAPLMINYVMNAGYIPLDSWIRGQQGGGRNRGEACHIYDLFTFLTDSRVRDVTVSQINPATRHYSGTDNFVASASFDDGSLATLTYTAMGSSEFPKEQMQVFVDGQVITLDDYKGVRCTGRKQADAKSRLPDKGHKAELEAFAQVIKHGGDWPIPFWQQVQATEIALRVEQCLTKEC